MKENDRMDWQNTCGEFCDVASRYLDLCDSENKSKIAGAASVLNYAVQDLTSLLSSGKQRRWSVELFYQLLVKTDILIGTCEFVYKQVNGKKLSKQVRETFWGTDYPVIKHFRLVRSLVLAHPLETTRFPDEGFGGDGEGWKWCEDVRRANSFSGDKGDFVLVVREIGKSDINRFQVWIDRDIETAIQAGVSAFDGIRGKLQDQILEVESQLKSERIHIEDAEDEIELVSILKEALSVRYPSWIDRYQDCDGSWLEHSILDDAAEMLVVSFAERHAEERFSAYRSVVSDALQNFADMLQSMTLPCDPSGDCAGQSMLEKVLHPDSKALLDSSLLEDKYYCAEKIEYLHGTNQCPNANAFLQSIKSQPYATTCSNLDWGATCFAALSDAIGHWFPVVNHVSGQQLYAQYVSAAYFAQIDRDVSPSE